MAGMPAFAGACSQNFPTSLWRFVPASNYIVLYLFSAAATGAAVANGWSAGRRWALRHWASAPERGSPWQQGPAVARGGADAPSRASRKRPKRLPALHPPVGETEKRDTARPEPNNRAGE